MGLAVRDAVGSTQQFDARDTYPLRTDMIGGGPFGLKASDWTDDTAMSLALADSLVADPDLDERDLTKRFVEWHEKGTYTYTCFSIGIIICQVLARWKTTGDPFADSTDPQTVGNGSLMRLSLVAVAHFGNRPLLRGGAALQSRITHATSEAVKGCVVYAEALAEAIKGGRRSQVLRARLVP
jgi:ADP-ribosyl-[dinitrogen reductase] hydrolase